MRMWRKLLRDGRLPAPLPLNFTRRKIDPPVGGVFACAISRATSSRGLGVRRPVSFDGAERPAGEAKRHGSVCWRLSSLPHVGARVGGAHRCQFAIRPCDGGWTSLKEAEVSSSVFPGFC